MKFQVVGNTDNHEVYVASAERKFNINEYLIIEDKDHNNPVCEVVETHSFNKFVPMVDEKNALLDDSVIRNLDMLGFSINDETINLAKVRVIGELPSPISVGASVRLPEFEEVEHILMQKRPQYGLNLGVIQGTGTLQDKLPSDINDISPLFDRDKGILSQNGVPFIFDHYGMKQFPHVLITGGSGSGKSEATRVILEELMEKKMPTIVFDPHYEMAFDEPFDGLEEKHKRNYKKNYIETTVGKDIGINFEDLTSADLCSILSSSKDITETMESAINRIHEYKDSLTSFQYKLERLIVAFESANGELDMKVNEGDEEAQKTIQLYNKYKSAISGLATLKGIQWRLSALVNEGLFTNDISLVTDNLLKRKTVVIRGSIRMLKIFAGYLINATYKKRRAYKDLQQMGLDTTDSNSDKFPPFFTVIDEAHNFCQRGDFMTPTKWVIREIAQEGRKYGVFLVLATQRPSLLDDTTLGQLNSKFIFRTMRRTDIETISSETDLSANEVKRLPYLNSGNAFISSPTIGRSVAIRFRVAKTKSPHTQHPFSELDDFDSSGKLKQVLMDFLPLAETSIPLNHTKINKAMKTTIPETEIIEALEEMAEENIVTKESTPFGFKFNRK